MDGETGGNGLKKLLEKPLHTAPGQVGQEMVKRYFAHDVARDSAALTYYLLFAIFPLLIFISTLVGKLDLDIPAVTAWMGQVAPAQVVAMVDSYLVYVTENHSPQLLWFSLIFSVWFPMRATGCVLHSMRKAFGKAAPENILLDTVRNFLYALVLIILIGASIAMTVVGRRALEFLARFFTLNQRFIDAWSYLRFVLVFVLLAFAIGTLYMMAQGSRRPLREVWPGVVTSLVLWMVLSISFSYYVENMANYAVLYGSIAAIVVVLLWLYMSAVVVILGAELAAVLQQRRVRMARKGEEAT